MGFSITGLYRPVPIPFRRIIYLLNLLAPRYFGRSVHEVPWLIPLLREDITFHPHLTSATSLEDTANLPRSYNMPALSCYTILGAACEVMWPMVFEDISVRRPLSL